MASLREASREEGLDSGGAVLPEEARAGAGEVRVADHRVADLREGRSRPLEPAIAVLVEDEERLVAELGELRPPAGAALDGVIGEDLADHVDLLAAVHLVPDALEHLLEERTVGVGAMHEPAHVGETHVAVPELGAGEHPDAPRPAVAMTLEGEVDLLDAVALGRRAELGLRPRGGPAEQDALLTLHRPSPLVTAQRVLGASSAGSSARTTARAVPVHPTR